MKYVGNCAVGERTHTTNACVRVYCVLGQVGGLGTYHDKTLFGLESDL